MSRWRCSGGAVPAVGPLDELDGEDERDGESDLGETVDGAAVGVAAQLPEVGEPRVGALDCPAQPEPERLLVPAALALAVAVVLGLGVVVAVGFADALGQAVAGGRGLAVAVAGGRGSIRTLA